MAEKEVDLSEIYRPYRDAGTWIEQAEKKIDEYADNFVNPEAIEVVFKLGNLVREITDELARFFEEMEAEGVGHLECPIPLGQLKKLTAPRFFGNNGAAAASNHP
jgi:hypothetical protein